MEKREVNTTPEATQGGRESVLIQRGGRGRIEAPGVKTQATGGADIGTTPQNSADIGTIEDFSGSERVKAGKRIFLSFWPESKGIVSVCAKKAGVSTDTFYDWKKADPVFKQALKRVMENFLDELEDVAKGKALIEKDGPMVRYMLDRTHPLYKPKSRIEFTPGAGESLEDLFDRDGTIEETHGNKQEHNEQGGDRGADTDPRQEVKTA